MLRALCGFSFPPRCRNAGGCRPQSCSRQDDHLEASSPLRRTAHLLLGSFLPLLLTSGAPGLLPWSLPHEVTAGGQLFSRAAHAAVAPAKPAVLLVPIVRIERQLEEVDALLNDADLWKDALAMLEQPAFRKKDFKMAFNAYSDTIIRDPFQTYMGQVTPPKTDQTLAYLWRNEALTAIEDLRAEIRYLIGERTAGQEVDTSDLRQFSKTARTSVGKFLSVAPPEDVAAVRNAVQIEKGGTGRAGT